MTQKLDQVLHLPLNNNRIHLYAKAWESVRHNLKCLLRQFIPLRIHPTLQLVQLTATFISLFCSVGSILMAPPCITIEAVSTTQPQTASL